MYTIERHAGRLLEVRQIAPTPLTLDEVLSFRDAMARTIRASAGPVVLCVDLRQATLFAPEAASEIEALMKQINPRLERSAIVLPGDRPTMALQMERLVRAAGRASRRTFLGPAAAAEWLGEILDDSERERLRVFLEL
ncbi:MAG TPA: hypothetical protein VKE22_21895 [Haliangiales bacterium]|nr:hypothetical protein [Haliangiales bacterium]